MRTIAAVAIMLAAFLSFAPGNSFGAQRVELYRTDGQPAGFGGSIAVEGNTVAVSGAGGPVESTGPGGAFVYQRNPATDEWTGFKLIAGDVRHGDEFGQVVAMEGNLVVVGAPRASVNGMPAAGAIYVFRREVGGWNEVAKLHATDPEPEALFGSDVAISGRRIIASAPQAAKHSPGRVGAAYLFGYETNAGWHQEKKLLPHDDSPGAIFARSVAIAGDFAAVGRYGADAVYLYQYDGANWRKVDILRPRFVDEPGRISGAGWDIAMEGYTLAVAAPEDLPPNAPEPTWFSGVVHVYENENGSWTRTAALSMPFDPITGFGAALALNDGHIAATSFREGSGGGIYKKNDAGDWSRVVFIPKRDINELLPIAVSRDFLVFPVWPLVDDHPCAIVHDLPSLKTDSVIINSCTQHSGSSAGLPDNESSQDDGSGGEISGQNDSSQNVETSHSSRNATNTRSGGGAGTLLMVVLLPLLLLRRSAAPVFSVRALPSARSWTRLLKS